MSKLTVKGRIGLMTPIKSISMKNNVKNVISNTTEKIIVKITAIFCFCLLIISVYAIIHVSKAIGINTFPMIKYNSTGSDI